MTDKHPGCPECDIPSDGYPELINKGSYYWCWKCKKRYGKSSLVLLGEAYTGVLDKIKKLHKDKQKSLANQHSGKQVIGPGGLPKSKKGGFGQTLPLSTKFKLGDWDVDKVMEAYNSIPSFQEILD
ncbi:hypothetical protein LCGC14_0986950, partial [marine sediment metagenome]